jgi:hypothetical protein
VLPGLENILSLINNAQYEHVGRSWKITEVQVKNKKKSNGVTTGYSDPSWFATVGEKVQLPDQQVLIFITKNDGNVGKNNSFLFS